MELNTAEAKFIHKLISEQSLRLYFDSQALGISEEHFTEDRAKEVWQYIVSHASRYNSIPDIRTVQEQFPEFVPGPVPERFEFYRDSVIKQFQKNKVAAFAVELALMIQTGEGDFVEFIGQIYNELIKGSNIHDFGKFTEMLDRIEKYNEKKASGEDPMGIPTGITELDNHFLGYRPGDYCVIAGRTGEGKTTLALFEAFSAWTAGYKVSYVTLEMPREQIFEKLDALATGISINKIKRLRLSDPEVDKYTQTAQEISENMRENIDINVHDRTGSCTTTTIEAILTQDEPDVLFVDSIYLMSPKGRLSNWEGIKQISNELKQLAMKYRKPIVVLSQVNRAGEEKIKAGELPSLADLSFSDALGQDADHVFVITSNPKTRFHKAKRLTTMKLRGAGEKDIAVKWDPTTNFIQYLDEYKMLRQPSSEVSQIAQLQEGYEDPQAETTNGPLQ